MNKEKAIANIIENFNFEKVHKVMTHLNWTWLYDEEPPSAGKLVLEAQKRLTEAFDKCSSTKTNYCSGSGGFYVQATYNEKEGCDYLELSFLLAEWEYYEE